MIASLVATLKWADGSRFEDTLNRLQHRMGIEMGQRFGVRLPMTIESESTEGLVSLTQWVQDLDGILHVDIVFASFEPPAIGE